MVKDLHVQCKAKSSNSGQRSVCRYHWDLKECNVFSGNVSACERCQLAVQLFESWTSVFFKEVEGGSMAE